MATTKITSNVIADDAITSDQLGGDLTMPGHISLADDKEIRVGTGNDLVIKHTGSHANITNTTGNLTLRGDTVYIANGANNEYMAQFVADGAASLRFNNVEELATVSGGVYIPNELGIGTNSPAYSLTVDAADGVADNTYVAFFRNQEGTDDRNFGVRIIAGKTASDKALSIDNQRSGGGDALTFTGAGNLGIGTNAPNASLDVVSNSSANGIELRGRSADNIGQLTFESNDSGTTYSQLQSLATELKVKTIANIPMSFHTNNTERMVIASNGNVTINEALLVGTDTAYDKLAVLRTGTSQTGGMTLLNTQNGGYGSGITWESKRSDANNIQTAGRISVQGYNSWNSDSTSSSKMVFSVRHSNTLQDIMTIQGGNLAFASGKGIDFSSTGTGSTSSVASHLLDDYEVGDFTPGLPHSYTCAVKTGRYVKVGDLVHFVIQIGNSFSNISSGNQFAVTGLPFPVAESHAGGSCFARYINEPDNVVVYVNDNENVYLYSSGESWGSLYFSNLTSVSAYFYIHGTYRTT